MPDDSRSSRREFLKGQSALNAAREKATSTLGEETEAGIERPESVDRQTGYVEQYSKNAMACEFELLFNLHQYPQAGVAVMEAFQLIDDLEDQMTVYRDHSEISQLNQTASKRPVVVEERLFELLKLALSINESTGGAFDITSSPLTQLWGFDKRAGRLPGVETVEAIVQQIGSEHVLLDEGERSLKLAREGVSLNLGGIGKGHALDRVGELFRAKGVSDFVIHGGQSSVLAAGDSKEANSVQEEPSMDAGWSIGVTHPTLPGVRLGEVTLHNQALGTSGTARQGFYHRGKRYGHIIDPRTGWPTSHFLSTTVVAPSAAVADALATAFYVMKREEIQQFCESKPEIGTILVSSDDRSKGKIDVEVINLDGHWIEK